MTTVINGQWSERGAVVGGCSYGWEMRGKEAVGRERREKRERERKKNIKKNNAVFYTVSVLCFIFCVQLSKFLFYNSNTPPQDGAYRLNAPSLEQIF